jgi:UDP-N-acetylmuramate dehydrogenase
MPDLTGLLHALSREDVGWVRPNEPLRDHSAWRIGGPADLFAEPCRADQIARILEAAREASLPVVVIGEGSNLLFDDRGVRGIVMKIGGRMARFSIEGTSVRAEAGAAAPQLARAVGRAGLAGLEHVIGIPGTLGGLIFMNGGSLRRSIGEAVVEVEAMGADGEVFRLPRDKCEFSYRRSVFQRTNWIITSAALECEKADRAEIRRRMLGILRERRDRFPLKWPNCGSVFTSEGEMHERFGPPGKVIEDTGLKGLRIGNAEVSRKHANFILNLGGAKSDDVLDLIRRVRGVVHERTRLWMACEVRYVDPSGIIRKAHEAV